MKSNEGQDNHPDHTQPEQSVPTNTEESKSEKRETDRKKQKNATKGKTPARTNKPLWRRFRASLKRFRFNRELNVFDGILSFTAVVGLVFLGYQSSVLRQSLENTRKSFRQERRAYVYVSKYEVIQEPTASNPNGTIVMNLSNSGLTPARILRILMPQEPTIGTRAPDRPDWTRLNDSVRAIPGARLTIAVFPGAGVGVRHSIPVVVHGQEQLSDYLTGRAQIFIRIRFYYHDALSEDIEHWTEVCAIQHVGQAIDLCGSGNDFDRNQQE